MRAKNKIEVHAASDVNITEEIEREIAKVVQDKIGTLSTKYFRTISADIRVNVE